MRKKNLFTLLILMASTTLFAQRFVEKKEIKLAKKNKEIELKNFKKSQSKLYRSPLVFKFNPLLIGSCYTTVKPLSTFSLKSNIGMGFNLGISLKISSKFTAGFGYQFMSYDVNYYELENSILQNYSSSHFSVTKVSSNQRSYNISDLYFETSYWNYHPKYILEYYFQIGLTKNNYNYQNTIFRRELNTHFSEYILLNAPNNYYGILPKIGMNAMPKLSNSFYANIGFSYGYHIIGTQYFLEQSINSNNQRSELKLNTNVATHFVQAHVGIIIRPINRIRKEETEYDKIDFKTNELKNQ